MASISDSAVRLGLRANLAQFALLVAVNAFVGGMVGLQRTLVPLIGKEVFGIASAALATSFIVSFGVVKACANLASGPMADGWGRKRVLILGWAAGLPVPFIIMWAPRWEWIVAANVLLGINQGLAWSMTVVMKVDLVGPARRGLALGLNEFAGYIAVGATAWLTGWVAARTGHLRPDPFYIGIGYAIVGLALSVFVVRDTRGHARREGAEQDGRNAALRGKGNGAPSPGFRDVFALATWKNRDLFAASQAGLVNNLNDGVVWGILPLFLVGTGMRVERVGVITAAYPLSWGVCQIATGRLSDRLGRKGLIVWGMWVQAIALGALSLRGEHVFATAITASVALGIGTAMVYPTLLAATADVAHPAWRARALSVYRFWRDMGYAIGGLTAGVTADAFGLAWPVRAAGVLTFLSGVIVWRAMRETRAG